MDTHHRRLLRACAVARPTRRIQPRTGEKSAAMMWVALRRMEIRTFSLREIHAHRTAHPVAADDGPRPKRQTRPQSWPPPATGAYPAAARRLQASRHVDDQPRTAGKSAAMMWFALRRMESAPSDYARSMRTEPPIQSPQMTARDRSVTRARAHGPHRPQAHPSRRPAGLPHRFQASVPHTPIVCPVLLTAPPGVGLSTALESATPKEPAQ